jgi:hypothetical protein
VLELVVGDGHDDLEAVVADPKPDGGDDRLAVLAVERQGGRGRRIDERLHLGGRHIELHASKPTAFADPPRQLERGRRWSAITAVS